jgi:hypothetical protein
MPRLNLYAETRQMLLCRDNVTARSSVDVLATTKKEVQVVWFNYIMYMQHTIMNLSLKVSSQECRTWQGFTHIYLSSALKREQRFVTADFLQVDSLENITHSLCTLEFESRRASYYWLLEVTKLLCTSRALSNRTVGRKAEQWLDPSRF